MAEKNKMKVGILTLKLHFNYGGILQAYALQEYLKKLGHEVILIDRQRNKHSAISAFKRWIMKVVFRKRYQEDKEKFISRQIVRFVQQYLGDKTEPIVSDLELKNIGSRTRFDAIVVGSDQVWRSEYTKSLTPNYFLDFADDWLIKLSYAASFGVDEWSHPLELTNSLSKLLKRFDGISVRENSAVSLCCNVFGVEALQHVDPTLLLEQEDYSLLFQKTGNTGKPNKLFAYILDESACKTQLIQKVETTLKQSCNTLCISKFLNDKNKKVLPSIESWISAFYYADYIVTDSFHGCVFSIIFNKPFIAIGNKDRGMTRFLSLLSMFNLQSRLLTDTSDLTDTAILAPIDWADVNQLIQVKRNEARLYFEQVLKR